RLDAEGVPSSHSTLLQLKSLQDALAYYPWVIDTAEVSGITAYGARMSEMVPYGPPGLFRFDFTFPRPVELGEMVSFEYELSFTYNEPPPATFLRQCRRPVENLDMLVRFHPNKRPSSIRWVYG